MFKMWFVNCECERKEEKERWETGHPVQAECPLCYEIIKVGFL